MQILQAIQANLAALDRNVSQQGRTLDAVRQDVRMIRATIRDMHHPFDPFRCSFIPSELTRKWPAPDLARRWKKISPLR
jgi:hypothetical protein